MKNKVITTKTFSKISLYSILLSMVFSAFAQTNFDEDEDALLGLYGDEEMISIAIGDQQLISKAPAVASVITKNDIQSMGATDLNEVLESIPGLHVSVSPMTYSPIYVFRGIKSTFNAEVLMLINGFPVTNLFRGDRNIVWGGLPLESVTRIEIIRGPGSAVYGADAFAGVINIITKGGKDISGTTIGGRYGSDNANELWLSTSKSVNDFNIGLTLEYEQSDGDDSVIDMDTQTIIDNFYSTSASNAPGSLSLSKKSLDIRLDIEKNRWRTRLGLQNRKDMGVGAGAAEALAPSSRYSSERINWDLTYQNSDQFKNWDLTADASYFSANQVHENDLYIYPVGTTVFGFVFPDGLIGNPDVWEKNYRVNSTAMYTGMASHKFKFGIGYHYGEIYKTKETKNFGINPATGFPIIPGSSIVDVSDTPLIFLPEENRENYHAFLQYIWQIGDDWEITIGDRFDNYSDFGATTNPRAALVWSVSQKLTAKLLYGKAFRAPAFAELFSINNPVALGNPNLKPERIENYELVFDYQYSSDLHFTFNTFQYQWSNIIEFSPGVGGLIADNVGKKNGRGLEAELTWRLMNDISLKMNYAWAQLEDKALNQDGWDFPQQQLYLSGVWDITSQWSTHLRLNHVMDRERHFNDSRKAINDYTQVNFVTGYHLSPFDVKLKINNLLDADIREPSSYSYPQANIQNDLPLPGRNYLIEASYSF